MYLVICANPVKIYGFQDKIPINSFAIFLSEYPCVIVHLHLPIFNCLQLTNHLVEFIHSMVIQTKTNSAILLCTCACFPLLYLLFVFVPTRNIVNEFALLWPNIMAYRLELKESEGENQAVEHHPRNGTLCGEKLAIQTISLGVTLQAQFSI